MAVPWFYAGPQELEAGSVRLSAAESRHAKSSRRLVLGDAVVLFDGQGNYGRGEIGAIEAAGVRVRVGAVEHRAVDASLRLTLAVSFPKGPRQDVLVEKCTELGAAAIWPMECRRSIAQPSDQRLNKLRRTVIEASKQAHRCRLCEIHESQPFDAILHSADQFDIACIAHPGGGHEGLDAAARQSKVLILIGPEGGFTEEELLAAGTAGFQAVGLGRTLLRTETAAIAAAARLLTPQ